jgi:hypothetical protein
VASSFDYLTQNLTTAKRGRSLSRMSWMGRRRSGVIARVGGC